MSLPDSLVALFGTTRFWSDFLFLTDAGYPSPYKAAFRAAARWGEDSSDDSDDDKDDEDDK